MSFVQLAFGFQGRIRRRDFWLGHILVAFTLGFLVIIVVPTFQIALTPVLVWAIRLPLLWTLLAIAVKRGHDRNRSAALIAALYAIDTAANLASAVVPTLAPWTEALEMVLGLYLFVDLGLLDGTKGDNLYGPSPKTPTTAAKPAVA